MHPIVPLAALSWVIVIAVITIAGNLASIALGSLPYQEASPVIAPATLCLAIATDAFIRVLHW